MLHKTQLHEYQAKAAEFIQHHPRSMLWLGLGLGKLQPNSEPVLTPSGWSTMGDLRPGDEVIGSDGNPTEVLGVFPQGEMDVVRVEFSDGSYTRAGWDHLWYVETNHHRARGTVGHVMTTRQIVDSGLTVKASRWGDMAKWYIPMTAPVQYPPVNLPVDPYLLGVILGDGYVLDSGEVRVTSDEEILDSYEGCESHHQSSGIVQKTLSGLRGKMRDLGLAGKRSWEKVVPEVYLRGSPDERLALLQGMLDTDGSPITKGGVEFSSTSENLTDAVVELAQSLGGVAKKKGPRVTRHQNGEGRPSWRVNVKLPGHMDAFRLTRKLKKWTRPTKYQPIRKIVNVVQDGTEESSCIKVAARDSLYLTRSFIVTHNTVSSLTGLSGLMGSGKAYGALVLGPKRVCQTVWPRETQKWSHLKHLRTSVVMGTKAEREYNLRRRAHVYTVNYENVPWLVENLIRFYLSKGIPLPFNVLIADEITRLKSTRNQQGGAWGQALLTILEFFPYRIGLTATPAPNGYKDLFGQYMIIDDGQRLGHSYSNFEDAYLDVDPWSRKVTVSPESKAWIERSIHDITLQMSTRDYLELPPTSVNKVFVDMPKKAMKVYKDMEKNMFATLESGISLDVENAAVASGRCREIVNGAVYNNPEVRTEWEKVHDAKLDALVETIASLQGDPALVGYQFKHDLERIKTRLDKEGILYRVYDRSVSDKEAVKLEDDFNSGQIPVLIGHGQSIGHGLNLQYGCANVVWFGLPWSLETFQQFNGRVADRQGQTRPVMVHLLLMRGTVDELVLFALTLKEQDETNLKAAVSRYRQHLIEEEPDDGVQIQATAA